MVLAATVRGPSLEVMGDTIPAALLVEDVTSEFATQRALRIIRGVGEVALQASQVESDKDNEHETLMDAIHHAAEGSGSARQLVVANALTDLKERAWKAGATIKVELNQHADGRMSQYGQLLRQVYQNALLFAARRPAMRRRIEAETLNGLRFEEVVRRGMLADYNIVIFSPFPDDMTDEEADKVGFFVESRSGVIQMITEQADGKLVQVSAFVAGAKGPGAPRHDLTAIRAMAAELGVSFEGLGATEILGTPVLVPKAVAPDVLALVARYDHFAGGTFFGQDRPVLDYHGYEAWCETREAQFVPAADAVADELIHQAASVTSPVQAIKLLHTLSQRELVDMAILSPDIDPRVFGSVAAAYIAEAQRALQQGDEKALSESRAKAQQSARSSSCPGAQIEAEADEASASNKDTEKSEIKKMKCPFCGDPDQYGDPCSPNQHCNKCGAKVLNGVVVNRGKKPKTPAPAWQLAAQAIRTVLMSAPKPMAKAA